MDINKNAKIDKKGMEQWLGSSNTLSEAIEILTEIFNGEYTIDGFRMDVVEYFQGDDRGDINR